MIHVEKGIGRCWGGEGGGAEWELGGGGGGAQEF